MKKLLVSILVFCYFAATFGVMINRHYCMNRLASIHLFEKSADICGRCGMETHESNGCCHDEVKVLKVEQDQNKATVDSYTIPALEITVSVPSDFIAISFYNVVEQRHYHNHSPPLLSAQDIYLQNNVFRI